MAYTRYLYNRIHWENKSDSLKTPLGKMNLNRMDSAIYYIAENLDIVYSTMQSQKLDITAANKMLRSIPVWDKDTGILTFQFYDGTEFSIDFNVEKIPVSFSMDSAGVITMVTEDGTEWRADIGELIPDYSFEDSDRVAFTKTKNEDGSYSITADIIKGSITGEYLEPDYLTAITVQASKAEASAASAAQSETNAGYDAKLAQSYSVGGSGLREEEDEDNALHSRNLAESFAHGGTGTRQDEDTDSAKYYKEEAEKAAANAAESEKNTKASEELTADSAEEAGKQAAAASLSADTAAQKASEASQSAVLAGDSAREALASETSAASSAAGAGDYAEIAKSWADKAASLSDIGIATEQKAGIVKPDGDTITVDEDGTLHCSSKVNIATKESAGVVKPDGESITIEEDGTIHAEEKKLGKHAESAVAGDDGVHGLKYSSGRFEAKDAEGNWIPVPVIIPETPSDVIGAMWFE